MASTKNDNSKPFIFKSEQHPTVLTEELKKFYDQNKFFDTIFKVGSEGSIIEVHQIVLCALSGYFLEIFSESQTSFVREKLVFNDIEFDTFKLIIDFMYSGTIELSVETIEEILRAALFLKVKTLIDGCCSFIQKHLKSNNCLRWFLLGYDLELPELKTIALEYISNNYKKISESKEFLKLTENEFKELQSYEHHLGEDVLMGIIAWLNFDNLNRKRLLLPLLTMVRFEKLTPKFILENRKKVCKTVESYEMICSWLQWHLLPETRSGEQLNQTLQPRNTMENKSQNQKLALLQTFDEYNALIDVITYNGNDWSSGGETYLSKVWGLSFMVLIDDKLVIAGGSDNEHNDIEYINLKTEERNVIPLVQKDREIMYIGDANGKLCILWIQWGGMLSLETYDFSTNEWTCMPNSLHYNAYSRSTIDNGIFYHISFDSGCLHSYNFDSMEWTSTVIAQDSLKCFSFVASGGFLYIMGGKRRAKSLKACKRYNLSTNSWSDIAPHPVGYQNLISIAFENKIITSNRAHIFEYDIDNNEWKQLSPVITKNNRVGTFSFSKLTTNT